MLSVSVDCKCASFIDSSDIIHPKLERGVSWLYRLDPMFFALLIQHPVVSSNAPWQPFDKRRVGTGSRSNPHPGREVAALAKWHRSSSELPANPKAQATGWIELVTGQALLSGQTDT